MKATRSTSSCLHSDRRVTDRQTDTPPGLRRCLRRCSKSIFGLVRDLDFWPPDSQTLSFHALAPSTTCVKCYKNRIICFWNIVFIVHKFSNRRTDGQTKRFRTLFLLLPVWRCGGIKSVRACSLSLGSGSGYVKTSDKPSMSLGMSRYTLCEAYIDGWEHKVAMSTFVEIEIFTPGDDTLSIFRALDKMWHFNSL